MHGNTDAARMMHDMDLIPLQGREDLRSTGMPEGDDTGGKIRLGWCHGLQPKFHHALTNPRDERVRMSRDGGNTHSV